MMKSSASSHNSKASVELRRLLAGTPLPALVKAGWLRHQENIAKPPLKAQAGRLVQPPNRSARILNQPPRPPRLNQGGAWAFAEVRQHSFMRGALVYIDRKLLVA